MFDQTTGCRRLAKLTHKINHHIGLVKTFVIARQRKVVPEKNKVTVKLR